MAEETQTQTQSKKSKKLWLWLLAIGAGAVGVMALGSSKKTASINPILTHKECQNGFCKTVIGAGVDTCVDDFDCIGWLPPQPTHFECQNGICKEVAGAGINTCNTKADCQAPQGSPPNPNVQYLFVFYLGTVKLWSINQPNSPNQLIEYFRFNLSIENKDSVVDGFQIVVKDGMGKFHSKYFADSNLNIIKAGASWSGEYVVPINMNSGYLPEFNTVTFELWRLNYPNAPFQIVTTKLFQPFKV